MSAFLRKWTVTCGLFVRRQLGHSHGSLWPAGPWRFLPVWRFLHILSGPLRAEDAGSGLGSQMLSPRGSAIGFPEDRHSGAELDV